MLRATPSDRAIARSVAPHSCLRRRISRTRRIDTLSAGIGSPARHGHDEQRRPPAQRSSDHHLTGWPTSNRNGRDQIGIGGRLHSGISGRLRPESAGKIVYISTTSVYRPDSRYGSSKILAEAIAEDYRKHRDMNVITLRPRGFIPYWNREVYASYSDWARWFWKGAVHIDDVAAAVILSLDLLSRQRIEQQLVLTLDSAYQYTDADLADWDAEGPGSTFKKYYPEYYDLARLLRTRSGLEANQAGYFRDGALAGLQTVL